MANCRLIRSLNDRYDRYVIAALESHGYHVETFSFENSADAFHGDDPVIICESQDCVAGTASLAQDFLNRGGNLIVLGGPAFMNEHYRQQELKTTAELAELFRNGSFGKTVRMDFSKSVDEYGFQPDTANPDSKKVDITATVACVPDGQFGNALQWHTDNFYINEAFEAPFSFDEGENVLGFYVCADENTRVVTVKVITDEGDVFKARVTPEKGYAFHMLSVRDFAYDGNRLATLSWRHRPSPLDFSKVIKLQFGHALSHAYSFYGEHTFRIAQVCTGSIPFINNNKVIIDGLCPKFKFFPVNNVSRVQVSHRQAILPVKELPLYNGMFSHPPRQQGLGFDNQRRSRFIPLIETIGHDGLNSGFLAYLIFNRSTRDFDQQRRGMPYLRNNSAIAGFTVSDPRFYEDGGADMVAQTLTAMLRPVMLVEGGTDEFIYRDDLPKGKLGALCFRKKKLDLSPYSVRLTAPGIDVCAPLSDFDTEKETNLGDYLRYAVPFEAADGDVSVSLYENGILVDQLTHKVSVDRLKPESERKFAAILKGKNEIGIDGKPVRFFGVNYMPTYDMANEDGMANEHYVSAFSYDPDVIDTDLQRCKNMGLNAVSLFVYFDPSLSSNNILHLMRRCEHYGLYVNLTLRPHANPFEFHHDEVKAMIEKWRLPQLDILVAYDIAWERYVGTYEPCYGNMKGRKSFDEDWRFFLTNRYGSIENAEKLLGYPIPRNEEGQIIGLPDNMLREDGPYNALVAAYRTCIDHAVRRAHIAACDYIRSLDPNHIIGARSGDASTIPLVDPGIYGYDYNATSAAFDYCSPESYALSDDINSVRQGVFTAIYARYANPDNVVKWMEFGKSIWTGSNFTANTKNKEFQAEYYRRFFDMLIAGHSTGMFCWWYFGGYRIGENSDFGIVDPDGGIRPVTRVISEYSPKFLNQPMQKSPDVILSIDRDLHSDGLRSVYRSVEEELFQAIEEGKTVAFADGSTGTTSANVSLVEVGNIPYRGCSPKYLDGIITDLNINGKAYANGSTAEIPADENLIIQISLQNTAGSTWLCRGFGSISLVAEDGSFQAGIPHDMAKRDRVTLTLDLGRVDGLIHASLFADGRGAFGDRLDITIQRI